MLDEFSNGDYKSYLADNGGFESMPGYTKVDLSLEEVRSKLSYEPETGKFTWLMDVAKNVKAGSEAGCFKGTRLNRKTGQYTRYMYIRLNNMETPAARVAWLLHYGEWPKGNVLFRDDDPSNFRIVNLVMARFPVEGERGDKKKNKMSKEAMRHYGLQRYYGLTIQEYAEKLNAQKNVCAICKGPETAYVHGKLKPLSVDHEHETGKVRALLCTQCNHMLGHARENRNILLEAVKYLDSYADKENVISIAESKS